MFTKFTLTLITLILVITLAGCGVKASATPSIDNSQGDESGINTSTYPAENQQMLPLISVKVANILLDDSVDGTTQQMKVGEVMAITLESNITTGYSWFATISDPMVLVQTGEPQYQEITSSADTPILGAAGKETFIIQAAETGTATVTLEYKQGFEKDAAPEKTIIFTVEVK